MLLGKRFFYLLSHCSLAPLGRISHKNTLYKSYIKPNSGHKICSCSKKCYIKSTLFPSKNTFFTQNSSNCTVLKIVIAPSYLFLLCHSFEITSCDCTAFVCVPSTVNCKDSKTNTHFISTLTMFMLS